MWLASKHSLPPSFKAGHQNGTGFAPTFAAGVLACETRRRCRAPGAWSLDSQDVSVLSRRAYRCASTAGCCRS